MDIAFYRTRIDHAERARTAMVLFKTFDPHDIPHVPQGKHIWDHDPATHTRDMEDHALRHYSTTLADIHHGLAGPHLPERFTVATKVHDHDPFAHGNPYGKNPGFMAITHNIYDENDRWAGNNVNHIWREHASKKHPAHIHIYRDMVDIPEEHQGKGIGKSTEHGITALAHHMHYHTGMPVKVSMLANLDIGGYAWAKAGYHFRDHQERKNTAAHMLYQAMHFTDQGELHPDHMDAFEREVKRLQKEKAHPRDFASIDIPGARIWHPDFKDGLPVGKASLIAHPHHGLEGAMWEGERWIGHTPMHKSFENPFGLEKSLAVTPGLRRRSRSPRERERRPRRNRLPMPDHIWHDLVKNPHKETLFDAEVQNAETQLGRSLHSHELLSIALRYAR